MSKINAPLISQPAENGQPIDGLCQHNPSAPDEVIRRGQEAMARQRRAFEDWMAIAEALQIGRAEVMREVHTNSPTGKRYEKAMAEWLIAHSFHLIDKGARNRLRECLKHKDEIEKWRARLTDTERFRFNHPDTVLRKWKAATVIPNPNAPPKTSAFAKLKEANIKLQEKLHRTEHEVARGADLWTSDDTAEAIARVMLDRLSISKAERVARAILWPATNAPKLRPSNSGSRGSHEEAKNDKHHSGWRSVVGVHRRRTAQWRGR
jgi:hypothetical protein